MKTPFLLTVLTVVGTSPQVLAQQSEIRLGGTMLSTHRNVAIDSMNPSRLNGTTSSAEFVARGKSAGIMFRYSQATFSPNLSVSGYQSLNVADGRLLLGPQVFAIEVGYMRRSQSSKLFEDPGEHLALAGARSVIDLGPSGFSISFAGQAIGRVEKDTTIINPSSGKVRIAGWSLETGLIYQAPRKLPFFGMLAYRFDRYRLPPKDGARREESSSIVVGGGLRFATF